MWSDPRFLIPPPIAAAIDRGRAHLRQETNPVRRLELEQLLRSASRGVPQAVDKLLALGPAPVPAKIYEKHRERENAARAAWLENRERRRYAEVRELYDSLVHGNPQTPRVVPLDLAKAHGLFAEDVTKMQQDAEEKLKQEKEEYFKKELDSYQKAQRAEALRIQEEKQRKEEYTWRDVTTNMNLHFTDSDIDPRSPGVRGLVTTYVPLLEYSSLQEILRPYYTAHFAPPWRDKLNITEFIPRILDGLQSIREDNLEVREEVRKYKSVLNQIWDCFTKKPHIQLTEHDYHAVRFQESLLDAFQRFLEQYGEGALVVLVLLQSLDHNPKYWIYKMNYVCMNYVKRTGIHFLSEDERYQGFNMLYLPAIVGREPLEIALLLERLAEIMCGLNAKFKVDCVKYYYRYSGHNPFNYFKDEGPSYDKLLPRGFVGRVDLINRELEKREDLQFLMKEVSKYVFYKYEFFGLAESACGGSTWHNWLVINYLLCRACDIHRYGDRIADRTFPQPTIKGVTPSNVAYVVGWAVRRLQELTQQDEENEENKLISQREYIQKKVDEKFSKKIIPLPDYLPSRVLTDNEIEALKAACLKELRQTEK